MARRAVLASVVMTLACGASPRPAGGEVAGWRTDGTGRYPSATPPVRWTAREPVVWKTPLPSWSNASPILVGGRIFICSEPADLLCLDAADGRLLWRRSSSYEEVFTPAEREKVRRAAPLRGLLRAAENELGPLAERLKAAPEDAPAKAMLADVKARIEQLRAEIEPLKEYALPKTHETNGYSSPTPVSDGRNVYVHTGMGTVACYGVDGGRKWIRLLEKGRMWEGHCCTPLLVGGRLIVQVCDVFCLDAATGKEVWRAKSEYRDVFGSPVAARVGGVELCVLANGDVLTVADGRAVARGLSRHKMVFSTPLLEGGVLYFVQHGGAALRLPERVGEALACTPLWTTDVKDDRYYASALLHQGLIYAITRAGFFSIIDAADGKVLHARRLDLGAGEVYASITLAGGSIYVSSSNGTTAVLRPGRSYAEVARNSLEPFRSTPVFAGERMYVRGMKHMYCIGR